jgi:hypothetical protein
MALVSLMWLNSLDEYRGGTFFRKLFSDLRASRLTQSKGSSWPISSALVQPEAIQSPLSAPSLVCFSLEPALPVGRLSSHEKIKAADPKRY